MNNDRCYQIFDLGTRARYLNQRESIQLRDKIKDLSFKQHLAVYRHVVDQNYLKIKLHEFSYENGQRDLYKALAKRKFLLPYRRKTNKICFFSVHVYLI